MKNLPEYFMKGMYARLKVLMLRHTTYMWDLSERNNLIGAVKDRELNDEQHLAEMASLMGPRPKEFLERSGENLGMQKIGGLHRLPISKQLLEIGVTRLVSKEQREIVTFAKKMLRWLPKD
ncbi:hypothetical protein GGR57DRAFT_480802 [Xylariaceae sp. FL1272]|nr:hypothetical protein GGR57DRAFT_480802 [Xylariaceae sp. FL1272]